jgi:hypothetical protein
LHYGANPCNTAPVATDANYTAFGYAPFQGSLQPNASDANAGEVLTFVAVSAPTTGGTLTVNTDGTFVFTPSGGFSGGVVSFTYQVTDNGYNPRSSNVATVTIKYPSMTALPVSISSFSGNVSNNKAQLSWAVAQNEHGNYFQVEKSSDGKTFTAAAIVMNTARSGAESYRYADAGFEGVVYYRLKVVNNNAVVTYSKMIVLNGITEMKQSNLTILQNPVTSAINFSYKTNRSGTGIINLYTTAGVKVYTSTMTVRSGLNETSFAINSRLAPGAYIMEVVTDSERSIARLVKH